MNPKEYEELICEHFRRNGYIADVTLYSNDYGVDVFAMKGKEKVAIQAKMYGNSRKINRQMVMELHGAKDYFECSRAIIATNGQLLPDAIMVAEKLKIEILDINCFPLQVTRNNNLNSLTFEQIWEDCIIPLQGTTLTKVSGDTNIIIKVDWCQVERITSN